MNDRLRAFFVELVKKYGVEKVRSLAEKLENARTSTETRERVVELTGWMDAEDLDRVVRLCGAGFDLEPERCAESLISVAYTIETMEKERRVSLVWTGPETSFVHPRRTESVLLEIIGRARKAIFLVSYVAFGVDSIVLALREASRRGVEIEILLESTGEYGGRIRTDSIGFFREALPEATIYWWNESNASVHAKCVVVDGEIAFVTSANLTGAAMERNMELGVLMEGGELPRDLHRHLEALVDMKIVEKVE